MSTTTPEPQCQMNASQMFDDLGGFEEIAIAKRFGVSINDLAGDATQFLRALIFVDLRRNGSSDGEAYKGAQAMKLGQVKTYFVEDEDGEPEAEADAEDEAGKGG